MVLSFKIAVILPAEYGKSISVLSVDKIAILASACHGVTPMCPPGGTYSIAGTLTSATDLASSRSLAACVAQTRDGETRDGETRDGDPEPRDL